MLYESTSGLSQTVSKGEALYLVFKPPIEVRHVPTHFFLTSYIDNMSKYFKIREHYKGKEWTHTHLEIDFLEKTIYMLAATDEHTISNIRFSELFYSKAFMLSTNKDERFYFWIYVNGDNVEIRCPKNEFLVCFSPAPLRLFVEELLLKPLRASTEFVIFMCHPEFEESRRTYFRAMEKLFR